MKYLHEMEELYMKPIERIEALLAGKKLDTPAINLWKHFPPYDEDPKELVKKTIQLKETVNGLTLAQRLV